MSDLFINSYLTSIRMSIYNSMKTDNPFVDTLITTICLSIFGYMFQEFNNINKIINLKDFDFNTLYEKIKYFYKRKNKICFEGKFLTNNQYEIKSSTHCSTKFRAITNYIISNLDEFTHINEISEMSCNYMDYDFKNDDFMMVTQPNSFFITNDIFINTTIVHHVSEDNDKKSHIEFHKINLELYSYKHSVPHINEFIDKITCEYKKKLKDKRENKLFIYSLKTVETKDDECKYNCWNEYEFISNKNMNNLYIDNKDLLLQKIDFFINNECWYNKFGIHYALGLCLYGPPGTGKTSLIKAIANYTQRHIIVISLKLIKTKRQLETFFFENRYNTYNDINSINFDKKIIVFEDIDCIGDIVKKRGDDKKDKHDNISNKESSNKESSNKESSNKESSNKESSNSIIKTLLDINDNNNNMSSSFNKTLLYEDPLTLDDLLNLWDGIRETPGRILIMTSNHYRKLDEALIRPGRIDINLELNKLSHKTLNDIYYNFYNEFLTVKQLKHIPEKYHTPAEIINIHINYPNKNDFYEKLKISK